MPDEKKATKVYTKKEIKDLLVEYFKVPSEYWDNIPAGSHIRFLKAGDFGEFGERFKPGGFVKNHWSDASGRRRIQLHNKRAVPKTPRGDYFTFGIYLDEIDTIWKKIDRTISLEFHLLHEKIIALKSELQTLKKP